MSNPVANGNEKPREAPVASAGAEGAREAEQKPEVEVEVPQVELEVEQAPQATTAVKEEKPEGLVRIYLLSMRLPSKYLRAAVKEVKREHNGTTYTEALIFDAKTAARIETIRTEAYMMISRVFAFVPEYGTWIAVTEEAVKEAEKVSDFVRWRLTEIGLGNYAYRYSVRAVPIYLEVDEAKRLLSAAIMRASEDVRELQEKIKEAEEKQKKTALYALQRNLKFKQALLEQLKLALTVLEEKAR